MRQRRLFGLAAAAIALGLVFAVPAGAADNTVGLNSTQHAQATQAAAGSCVYSPIKPADSFKGIPPFNPVSAAKPFLVRLYTTQGVITFRALTDKAPCTTNSFKFLAQHDYYDRTHCHRLTTARIFVLQCGDPTGTGSGGPGYQFEDENLAGATYPAGTVAMANAGPNTNGSQFFFTWKDTTLRPNYTPFGVVVGGLDVLQKIAAAGEDDQNNPGDGYPNVFVKFLHVQVIPE
ncbi:MAG TPA: peptidylprolyl isomerase [Pseudonocardiaceae bacterium]|nr:peptidylprolyl isomerase [Pseudonocardiaceae bacterium]